MEIKVKPRSVRVHAYNNSAFTVQQQYDEDTIKHQSSALENEVKEAGKATDNSDIDIDDVTDYSTLPLYVALKPLMFSMKLSGLHYVRHNPRSKNEQNNDQFRRCCCNCSGFQIYSWILAAVSWIYFVFFSAVIGMAEDRSMMLAIQAWILEGCLNVTCLVIASHHPKAMRKMFVSFARLRRYGGMLTNLSRLRSVINIFIASLWTFATVGIAVFFYLSFEADFVTDFIFNGYSSIMSTTSTVILAYFNIIWLTINSFELCISVILYREFRAANKRLKAKVRTDANLSKTFEMERRRFIEMTRAVSAADSTLALHHLSSFCCDIAILCLVIYKVIFDTKSESAGKIMAAYWFWMMFTVTDLAIICLCGTLIIMGMEKLKEPLHFIKLNESYHSQFNIQVSMFFTKLNERIGLTVGSLFVIDQTAVLSLIGMFITYFLLVVQFASLLLTPSSTTNSTTSG